MDLLGQLWREIFFRTLNKLACLELQRKESVDGCLMILSSQSRMVARVGVPFLLPVRVQMAVL